LPPAWSRQVRVLQRLLHGNAPTVVADLAAAIREERDLDRRGVARHRLVDGVVDHLVDHVVEPGRTRRADVHARPLPDRLEAFEDLDGLSSVRG
jgi:hypothetical protein